jgi:hypothetical protein
MEIRHGEGTRDRHLSRRGFETGHGLVFGGADPFDNLIGLIENPHFELPKV